MNKLLILIYIILWSCFANSSSTIMSIGPFLVDTSLQKAQPQKEVIIENLPKFFSSGIFNLCSPTSATFILQKYACDNNQNLNKTKCEDLDDQKIFSPFSLMSFYKPSSSDEKVSSLSYDSLPLKEKTNEFESGTGTSSLRNAKLNGFSLYPNSCFPFDQFINNTTSIYQTQQNAQASFFENLEKLYEIAKKKFTIEGEICLDCLTENDQDYKNIASLFPETQDKLFFNKFKQAILRNTFKQFLYTIFFSKCKKISGLIPPPQVLLYPETDLEKIDTIQIKKQIVENINTSKPTMLTDLCIKKMDPKDLPKCKNRHDLVITGYRDYYFNGHTKTYFQIKQTFGKDFDEQYGWVDADELLKNIAEPNKKATLVWLEKSNLTNSATPIPLINNFKNATNKKNILVWLNNLNE